MQFEILLENGRIKEIQAENRDKAKELCRKWFTTNPKAITPV